MSIRSQARLILALLFLWSPWATAWAQTQSPSPSPSPTASAQPTPLATPTLSGLAKKLAEVEARLEEVPIDPGLRIDEPGAPPAIVTSLRKIEASLRRHITLEEQEVRLRDQLKEVDALVHKVTQGRLDEERPYKVATLDRLQTELSSARDRSHADQMSLKAARTSLTTERETLAEMEAFRRRLLDKLERARRNDEVDLELERQIDDATAAVEAGTTAVALGEAEVRTAEIAIKVTERREELLKLKLEYLQEKVRFTRETLKAQLEDLEQARNKLSQALDKTRASIEASSGKLDYLLKDEIDDQFQENEIAAREDWLATHQRAKSLNEKVLELNLLNRDLWERRFLISQGQAGEHYSNWKDSANGLVVRLENRKETLTNELTQLRSHLAELLEPPGESMSSPNPWASVHAQALVARQGVIERTLAAFNETHSLALRLISELTHKKKTASLQERGHDVWQSAVNFWNIELYTLGDRSVTVGKLFIAVMVLLFGLTIVGRVSHFLGTRFITHLPVEDSVKFNLERILRYFFILLVFLFALHVVNIPLTIFTFLGGTLAIAVGFGAQNILNNFISGLILMVEKPVRVGDLIEVQETIGFVEEIGARSTRVRIPTGIHVVLPNSVLLENQVVNWTLTDQKIRTSVSVGVDYGTSGRKVMELLKEAASNVMEVNDMPAPVVIFDEFADSSLNFTVHFWVTILSPLDKCRVETQVRLEIQEILSRNGVGIPFPQRDLNFNNPVPVTIVKEDDEAEEEEE